MSPPICPECNNPACGYECDQSCYPLAYDSNPEATPQCDARISAWGIGVENGLWVSATRLETLP